MLLIDLLSHYPKYIRPFGIALIHFSSLSISVTSVAVLFFQYFAFYNNEYLPQNYFLLSRFKMFPNAK